MSSGFRLPHVLPPAGGFPTTSDLFNAWSAIAQTQNSASAALRAELVKGFGAGAVQFFTSGTTSLFQLFNSLSEHTTAREIGIASYTCPDIAAAAVRAGFSVLPLELNPLTLEPELGALSEEALPSLAAIVFSNLYGLPDRIEPWKELAAKHDILLVDDACQSLLSHRDSAAVGLSKGCVGVVSFGRGKAIHGIGGGAILWPSELSDLSVKLQFAISEKLQPAPTVLTPFARRYTELKVAILRILERPACYVVPAHIPWFGLGQTVYREDFPLLPAGPEELFVALAQVQAGAATTRSWTETAGKWYEQLREFEVVQPWHERSFDASWTVTPIRYPILFADRERRDRAFFELDRQGLGASLSYPTTLRGFPELAPKLKKSATPNAEQIAGLILTLPVHRGVSEYEIAQSVRIIKGVTEC